MHTEEEAKKKWCPINALGATMATIETKREVKNKELMLFHCHASQCMMWKWDENSIVETKTTYSDEVARDFTRGCCGLTT